MNGKPDSSSPIVQKNVPSDFHIKRRMWAITLLVILVVSLLWGLSRSENSNDTQTKGKTLHSFEDSDSPGEVIVGKRKFAFPRRYFWGFMGPRSGYAKTVNLMVLLPDLEPYRESNKAEFTDCLGWCRRVSISISESIKPWHFKHFAQELVDWSRLSPFDREKLRHSYSGLEYLTLIDPNNTSTWDSRPDEGYFYRCSPLRTPKPSCTVNIAYDERVNIRVAFSKEYLADLPRIVARIKTFLNEHQK